MSSIIHSLIELGIRAPRNAAPPGRAPREKPEPYGPESADFSTRRYMQRDVEIEFEAIDKNGGFIGAMYLNKTENAAIELVREGLATVHAYSAENLPWAKQLTDAEVRHSLLGQTHVLTSLVRFNRLRQRKSTRMSVNFIHSYELN